MSLFAPHRSKVLLHAREYVMDNLPQLHRDSPVDTGFMRPRIEGGKSRRQKRKIHEVSVDLDILCYERSRHRASQRPNRLVPQVRPEGSQEILSDLRQLLMRRI